MLRLLFNSCKCSVCVARSPRPLCCTYAGEVCPKLRQGKGSVGIKTGKEPHTGPNAGRSHFACQAPCAGPCPTKPPCGSEGNWKLRSVACVHAQPVSWRCSRVQSTSDASPPRVGDSPRQKRQPRQELTVSHVQTAFCSCLERFHWRSGLNGRVKLVQRHDASDRKTAAAILCLPFVRNLRTGPFLSWSRNSKILMCSSRSTKAVCNAEQPPEREAACSMIAACMPLGTSSGATVRKAFSAVQAFELLRLLLMLALELLNRVCVCDQGCD